VLIENSKVNDKNQEIKSISRLKYFGIQLTDFTYEDLIDVEFSGK
jgi:hypothetical protein